MMVAAMDPFDYRAIMPFWVTLPVWGFYVASLMAFYCLINYLLLLNSLKRPNFTIYFPVVGLTVMTMTTFLSNYLVSLISGRLFDLDTAFNHMGLSLVIIVLIETIFFRFVRPPLLQLILERTEKQHKNDAKIRICGNEFVISDILSLKSMDHYIEVLTVSGTQIIRCRLVDFLEHMDDCDGIRSHRSHWVSCHEIERFVFGPEFSEIKSKSGAILPIAKGRKADVENWANKHLPDVISGRSQ